ncbi:MAG TPA: ABC transporter ATP-binding protein [Acetobacteraceae bacterium]|nr:ABC transporter ATP-binding protein [Acetobacteraceae bacterium]
MTPALELRALNLAFGALAVTRNVSLAVAPGEAHALIGPNGAGKTTLLAQIAGTLRPASGRVLLAGRDVTALPPHRRALLGLARTFQVSALAHGLSALENVALAVQRRTARPLALLRRAAPDPEADGAALAALEAVGIAARAGLPVRDLSHGERRAAEIACALAARPACLLLDEPLAGLGPAEAAAMIGLLRGLKGRTAMLLVEHDMEAVFALADRVSVLVRGEIIASGAPALVRADPAARAAYLGED